MRRSGGEVVKREDGVKKGVKRKGEQNGDCQIIYIFLTVICASLYYPLDGLNTVYSVFNTIWQL